METHREDTIQGEGSEGIHHVVPCECDNHINVGLNKYPAKVWVDHCHIHGVGTKYFQDLKVKPYGYAYEANTTREAWLRYKRRTEKKS